MPDDPTHLPRPFYDQWSRSKRPAAHALWHWHSALTDPTLVRSNGTGEAVDAFFDAERDRAQAGDRMRLVPETVWRDAYQACDEYGLDRDLLAHQVDAARHLHGETRFETASDLKAFVGRWAAPHARLLARLAGVELSIQLGYADELARGFFHLGRLVTLPRDVANGRLFLPLETLDQKGVTIEQLREGRIDDDVRGLLWKESVRVRDALAQGRPLVAALSLRHRFALKRFWIGALELLDELERRDYDLWSRPLRLSVFRRVQVYLQTLLGRGASR
jgi:phytoene synthase